MTAEQTLRAVMNYPGLREYVGKQLSDAADMALASVRDAEPVAEVVQREPYVDGTTNAHHELNWRLYNCENALPVGTKLYLHPTAHPSADELLREAFAACEPYVGRGDDCGRLARLVSYAINATLARSAT